MTERTERVATLIGGSSVVAAVLLLVNGVLGYAVLYRAPDDRPTRPVDAVVVLGGEHDGREDVGISLAHDLGAPTVLLSNPYPAGDAVMSRVCDTASVRDGHRAQVRCFVPDPSTTHGEALATRRYAESSGWSSVAVVSWRYHLPRTRQIFSRCLDGTGITFAAVAVPRSYDVPVAMWEYLFAYQFAGMATAAMKRC